MDFLHCAALRPVQVYCGQFAISSLHINIVGRAVGNGGGQCILSGEKKLPDVPGAQFLVSAQFAHCETMDANSNKKLPVPGTSVVISVFVVICLSLKNTESKRSMLF